MQKSRYVIPAKRGSSANNENNSSSNNTKSSFTSKIDEEDEFVTQYFSQNIVFRQLQDIKTKVGDSKAADEHFQQNKTKCSDVSNQRYFYDMMRAIMLEINDKYNILSVEPISCFLDVCFAPGGFSSIVSELQSKSIGFGITLPEAENGHTILIQKSDRYDYCYQNLLKLDLGEDVDKIYNHFTFIPDTHNQCEFVICDGHYSEETENHRVFRKQLFIVQMLIAFNRLKEGGRILVKLTCNQIMFHTMMMCMLLQIFDKIECFKPTKGHKIRGSFYLLGFGFRPDKVEELKLKNALFEAWKQLKNGTNVIVIPEIIPSQEQLVETYGPALAKYFEPVWETQRSALQAFWKSKVQRERY